MSQPVTLRYAPPGPAAAVTLRYLLGAASTPASLKPGSLIGPGYRIEQGPLQPSSGEGDVYLCRLHDDGEPLVLKLYQDQLRPDPAVMAQLVGLSHPNLVRILDQGQWQGRFYEVMAYCAGGSLLELMPCNEIQLRDLLAQIAAGLDYCHRRGIVHCDIKPGNLFFADTERKRLCIGDFGISAHSDSLDTTHITRNQGDLTLDYAAPELVEGNLASAKSDYYALGISLLHLLQGQSPFAGKRPGEIIAHHLRGQIPLPEGLSEPMALLVRGLTAFDPDRRWGYRELMAFLHGDFSQLGQLEQAGYRRRALRPYPGFPQASDCQTLAAHLADFDALKQLQNGDIRRWLFDQVDAALAAALEPIEALARSRPQQALLQLGYLLDPQQPLRLPGHELHDLAQLVSLLASQPEALVDAWRSGALALWIESGRHAGEQTPALLQRIQEISQRHPGQPETALEALLYHLDPQRPFRLQPGLLLRHPAQLAEALRQHQQQCLAGLRRVIFNGLFEEWLRAAQFDNWQALLEFVSRVRGDYADQHQLGAYCLLWRLQPSLGLPFAGQSVRDPRLLVQLVEAAAEQRAEALKLMQQGWLRAWLVGAGHVSPGVIDQLLLAIDLSPEAKLETLLHSLAPGLEAPRLELQPNFVTFGSLQMGLRRERELRVLNRGRGHLYGRVLLAHFGQGISLDGFVIDGDSRIKVQLDTTGLMPGQYHNQLRLLTNAGEQELGISFHVQEPADDRNLWERLTDSL
ncbi:MAG: serine/threonine protein kinase [Gammaproteobacteria bacterium]|nr:serine/threonine protein kinase [Gammaproteobacteria bacterium]